MNIKGILLGLAVALGGYYLYTTQPGASSPNPSDSQVPIRYIGGGGSEKPASNTYNYSFPAPSFPSQGESSLLTQSQDSQPAGKKSVGYALDMSKGGQSTTHAVDIFAPTKYNAPDRFASVPSGGYADRYQQQSVTFSQVESRSANAKVQEYKNNIFAPASEKKTVSLGFLGR